MHKESRINTPKIVLTNGDPAANDKMRMVTPAMIMIMIYYFGGTEEPRKRKRLAKLIP